MDGSLFGPSRFELHSGESHEPVRTAPELGREPWPEREWGLTAWQVVAVVLGILAVCEVIGALTTIG